MDFWYSNLHYYCAPISYFYFSITYHHWTQYFANACLKLVCHRSGKIGRRLLRLHRGGKTRVLGESAQSGRCQHRDGVVVVRGADAHRRHQGGRHLRVADGPAQERPGAGAQGGARGVAGAAPEAGGALHQKLPGAKGSAVARRPLRLHARAQPAPLQARPARVRDLRLNCSCFHKTRKKILGRSKMLRSVRF
jgi:hypothetical protein